MKIKDALSIILAALAFFLPALLSAQVDTVWVNRWTSSGAQSDWAYAIAVDDSGNAYVTGKTENAGTSDDWTTIKYLPNGDTAWVRNFVGVGSANERASSIAIGPLANIYITGYTMSSSAGDYLTIKYRPDGDTAWTRRYNGIGNSYDFAHWIAVDDQENVYVTGYSRGLSYQDDIATVKYDSSGNQLWVARFNGTGNYNDKGYKVIADHNGHVYVTGYVNPFASGTLYDCVTIKYDAVNGDTVWARTYNGPADSSDQARDIEVDTTGNVYVTGTSRGVGTLSDIVTIKYDSTGGEEWVERYDNPDTSASDGGYGIEIDDAGNVYVVGQSQGLGTGSDIVTIKYDSGGTQQWATRYNGPANDYDTPSDEVGGKCMALDQSANIYVAGVSKGATSLNDFVAIMYSPDSIEQWVAGYNCCDSVDYALAIAIDTLGGVYICGRSIGLGTYYDMAAVKYQSLVGIKQNTSIPSGKTLLEIHPNPFKNTNTIRYSLPSAKDVTLSIYDALGRLIKVLVNAHQQANVYSVTWDGKDEKDRYLANGIYFCTLDTGSQTIQKKIVMVK